MERNLMQLNIQRAQEEIDRKKELVSKGKIGRASCRERV